MYSSGLLPVDFQEETLHRLVTREYCFQNCRGFQQHRFNGGIWVSYEDMERVRNAVVKEYGTTQSQRIALCCFLALLFLYHNFWIIPVAVYICWH